MLANIALDNLAQVSAAFGKIIPAMIGALITLIVGYVISKIAQKLVGGGLDRLGLDRRINASQASPYVRRVTSSPSRAIGRFTFWLLMFFTVSLAITNLGIGGLTRVLNVVYHYLPNVLAAALILAAAGIIAGVAAGFASRVLQGTATGKLVAGIVPAFVFSIAGFMILDQLKIATPIVTITYAAIVGAIALGSALAFGLGGRELAGRVLEQAYASGQERAPQMRAELQTARQRTADQRADTAAQPAPGLNPLPTFGERLDDEKEDA